MKKLEPIDWQIEEEPHIPYDTEDHPCVNCPVGDFEEDYDIYEKLYQSGDLVPEVAKAYAVGKDYGYEQGMKELSIASEENYVCGYRDCLVGEPPFVADDELKELLEQNKSFSVDTLSYDTDFLDYVKELQDKISKLHKYSDNSEFRKEIYDIFHLITVITENQVMKPVYDYWVKLEDLK